MILKNLFLSACIGKVAEQVTFLWASKLSCISHYQRHFQISRHCNYLYCAMAKSNNCYWALHATSPKIIFWTLLMKNTVWSRVAVYGLISKFESMSEQFFVKLVWKGQEWGPGSHFTEDQRGREAQSPDPKSKILYVLSST